MKLQPLIPVLLTSVFCFTALLLPLLPVEADLNSDRQALLAFASSVKHTRKLNWNAATPVCGWWVGITCNGTWVVAVRLPGIGLSGSIPPKTLGKLDGLRVLSLRSNYLNGNFPSDIASIASLQLLYLQGNNFSGALPTFFSPQLSVLDFSYNSFTGNIPGAVQNLTGLAVLNLQHNCLSGKVPDFTLSRLRLLNLSYNSLNGSIPLSLQKFPVSSFSGGNSLLCGLPLKQCPSTSSNSANSSLRNPPLVTHPQNSVSRKKFGPGPIAAVSIGGFGFLVLLAVTISLFCKKTKSADTQETVTKVSTTVGKGQITSQDFGSGVQEPEKNKLFFFEGYAHSFDLEDLLKASAEVLGKGSYGTTYKASLEDGTSIVVKRLKEVAVGKKEFEVQMEVFGRIGRHPNIVPLRAYYYSKDDKLLVCNYMPSGSVFSALHGGRDAGRTPLDWDTRMKIVLGTARAIATIHKEGGPKFIHGNIKSSNVLLNEDLDPCISDIALAPLMTNPPTKSRALGYRAPEVIETQKASHKSDVYSFGVLILEMLTGKAPLQPTGHDDVIDLPRWVLSVVREEWTAEVFDVELLRYQNVEEEMVQMLQVALACVTKLPEARPGIEEVVRMVEEIRQPESKNRTSNSEAESNGLTP